MRNCILTSVIDEPPTLDASIMSSVYGFYFTTVLTPIIKISRVLPSASHPAFYTFLSSGLSNSTHLMRNPLNRCIFVLLLKKPWELVPLGCVTIPGSWRTQLTQTFHFYYKFWDKKFNKKIPFNYSKQQFLLLLKHHSFLPFFFSYYLTLSFWHLFSSCD